jgi:polyphenol oxidase
MDVKDAGFYWKAKSGVTLLVCKTMEELGFVNGFSTRMGGVSDMPENSLNLAGFNEDEAENIYENRRRFIKALGGKWKLATSFQVHSAEVCHIASKDLKNDKDRCDSLITDLAGILLGIKTADCVPLLLCDIRTRSVGAIHAGWRGTLSSITVKTLNEMEARFGTRPKDVVAVIGPAARGCCYEVGQDVIEPFRKTFSYGDKLFSHSTDTHSHIDLHLANKYQLMEMGVKEESIFTAPMCTMCRPDLFFSYRLEKRVHGRVGRLLAVIGKN